MPFSQTHHNMLQLTIIILLVQEPWDQRPLVSIACLVMSFHLLRSWAKLFSSCSQVLHQLAMPYIHSVRRLPLLFVRLQFLTQRLRNARIATKVLALRCVMLENALK